MPMKERVPLCRIPHRRRAKSLEGMALIAAAAIYFNLRGGCTSRDAWVYWASRDHASSTRAIPRPLEKRGSMTRTPRERSGRPFRLPDWRVVSDCSTLALDCPAKRRGMYGEYPFQIGGGRTVSLGGGEGEDIGPTRQRPFDWMELSDLPEEWAASLRRHAPALLSRSNKTSELPSPTRLSPATSAAFVYPPEVPTEVARRCIRSAESIPFSRQVVSVLGRLVPDPDLDMISFTIADENYARDMLHEVWEMARDVVDFPGGFFFVALDRYTVEQACRYGYAVVAGPGALPVASATAAKVEIDDDDPANDLKSLVQSVKFASSLAVAEAGRNFFFFEMDVWFLSSPKPLLRRQQTDWLVSTHQDCPFCGNIGVYGVKANDATRAFFRQCLDLMAQSPDTHDQVVMNDVASLHEAVRQGKEIKAPFGRWKDPIPPVPEDFRAAMSRNQNNTHAKHRSNVTTAHFITRSFFGPHDIAANVHPIPAQQTVAIHTLADMPLTNPHGKKMVAKELGAWHGYRGPPGAGGGYYDRSGPRRRYLLTDGRILGGYSFVEDGVYHDGPALSWTIATLVAIARRTGRIWILPRIVSDSFTYYLWTMLDLESVSELGVEIRETNFPSNRKSWLNGTTPFGTVARTALFDGGKMFAQLPFPSPRPANAFIDDDDSDGVFAWRIASEERRIDSFFALLTAVPEIRDSEALFVNPSFAGTKRFRRRMREPNLCVSEAEIKTVHDHLRWCHYDGKSLKGTYFVREVGRTAPADDCYGRGRTQG